MKLSICIPVHHGRAESLRVLMESIICQCDADVSRSIEVCISDNGSQDGTASIVASYEQVSPIPVKYHRFSEDQGGVANFLKVVSISDSEYCWLVGSDDVIVNGGLEAILNALSSHTGTAGAT